MVNAEVPKLLVLGGHDRAAIAAVVAAVPIDRQWSVIVHAPDPDGLVEQLRTLTTFAVHEVTSETELAGEQIYVVAAARAAEIVDRTLRIRRLDHTEGSTLDKLLRSVAVASGRGAVAVILAGPGVHGALGIKRIKELGGITIAQADARNNNSQMPTTAMTTGMVDLMLPLDQIATRLERIVRTETPDAAPPEQVRPQEDTDTLRDILALVRIRSGHDFGNYKRGTLFRRVARRMQVCDTPTMVAYHQYLRENPGELGMLLRDVLISVTSFFRDADSYNALARDVVPTLFAGKEPSEQVRVWVAGCATGEEAYSIAILLAEHATAHHRVQPVQIFATDIDERALAEAREGRYPETIAADVGPERLARFFTRESSHYRISKEIRERVLFSPHNLLRDPPFSRLDLVSCRNLLIYLNRDAQDRVLRLFHFSLRPDGLLFLGSSETAENTSTFSTVDAKYRIFKRRSSAAGADTIAQPTRWHRAAPVEEVRHQPLERATSVGELHFQVVERYAPPSILVSEDLDVLHVSEHAGRFLEVAAGEPTTQLLRMVIPPLRLDLRTAIHAARQPGRRSEVRHVRWDDHGRPRSVELRVVSSGLEHLPGAMLVLFDEQAPGAAEPVGPMTSSIEPVVRGLETELHATREQLRATVEQYETSLEELKASNEELQATNEELRAATEELETSKEELQSVNEELSTLNHELKVKVDEISHANSDLQNLMSSTDIGVLFLDRNLLIQRFTSRAQDLFNVIPTDLGRPLAHLTHRLQATDLAERAKGVLSTLRVYEREVASTDDRRYLMRLLPYRSLDDRIEGVVLTFVDVTELRAAVAARQRSEAAAQLSEDRLRFALVSAPIVVLNLARDGRVTWGFAFGTELEPASAIGIFARGHADRFVEIARQAVERGEPQRTELEVVVDGGLRTYDFRIEAGTAGVNAIGFDITPSKLAEASLRDSDRRKDEFLATLSHELRNPLTPLRVALDVAMLAEVDPDKRTQSLAIMDRQVKQLTELVDELLDLSRITQGKIELERVPVDPVAVVEAALEATQPMIQRHGHQLRLTLPDRHYRVIGDRTRLVQVVTNLVTNAVKYTPDGGSIDLAIAAADHAVTFRVRDSGIGIPPEMLPHIFDIFVQCRDDDGRARGGLGIGLNLVQRLVELHGGTVSARSDGPGRGSEFVVELPATQAG